MSDRENEPSIDTEEVFDPSVMKKKKKSSKKKSVPLVFNDEPTDATNNPPPAQVADEDDENLDFSSLKKKKKKSKKVPQDLVPDEDAATEPSVLPIKKKKKSKSIKADESEGEVEAPTPYVNYHERLDGEDHSGSEADDVVADDLDSGVPEDDDTNFAFTNEEEVNEETWIGTDRDYTYDEILSRVFRILHAKNPALAGGRKRYTIVPPQVAREGSKKTVFANIDDICTRMQRNYDHLVSFLYAELGTSGSVDGAKRLIIKGRFQPKQIENVLRRYIIEYVTCKTCKSPETILRKENRLYFMHCKSCGSSRSVSAIQGGFKAQVGSRKAAKAKAS